MNQKFYLIFILSTLFVFCMSSLTAQQSSGSIVLTNFGDSTYVSGMAGEFNYTEFEQGQTINVKGMYGDLSTAVEMNCNYTIFTTDWSSVAYDSIVVYASTAMGNMDGLIDVDFTFPMDADTFGVHDIFDPVTDSLVTQAPTFFQTRVWHNVLPADGGPDVFWYEFVRLRPAGSLTSAVDDFVQLEGVSIFPNPASNELNITTEEPGVVNVMVYDVSGRRVIDQNISGGRLDVSSLQSGYHVIKVEQEGKIAISRVMIK